jgi:hypothetical protein
MFAKLVIGFEGVPININSNYGKEIAFCTCDIVRQFSTMYFFPLHLRLVDEVVVVSYQSRPRVDVLRGDLIEPRSGVGKLLK